MNDPKDQPIDIEEQRAWLNEHKRDAGLPWKQLSSRTGVPDSTLSLFAGNNYKGRLEPLAEAVFRYRQTLAQQSALKSQAIEIPGFYETQTSNDIVYRLRWAQRGRIVLCALGPGCSKTVTAKHYQACNALVFLVTMAPATAGIHGMLRSVLRALGDRTATGNTETMSRLIKDRLSNLNGALLIFDEAQHLTTYSIEEIRHWHDEIGVGIALLGNETVQQKLDGGTRSAAFAQIFSRISLPLVRSTPLSADVDAMLEAWDFVGERHDEKIAAEVHRIARMPGGLRGATYALELALMLANGNGEEFSFNHVQDAWAQLSKRAVAA